MTLFLTVALALSGLKGHSYSSTFYLPPDLLRAGIEGTTEQEVAAGLEEWQWLFSLDGPELLNQLVALAGSGNSVVQQATVLGFAEFVGVPPPAEPATAEAQRVGERLARYLRRAEDEAARHKIPVETPRRVEGSSQHQAPKPIRIYKYELDMEDLERLPKTMREVAAQPKKVRESDVQMFLFRALNARNLPEEERRRLNQLLVETNQPLVYDWLKRHGFTMESHPQEMEDLIQNGNLGLLEAVRHFDPERGRFSTYADWWILQAVVRNYRNTSNLIRIPVYLQEKLSHFQKMEARLAEELGRTPEPEELARVLGWKRGQVERAKRAIAAGKVTSLDQALRGHGSRAGASAEPIDPLTAQPTPEGTVPMADEKDLYPLLKGLDSRERLILKLRFGIGTQKGSYTLQEIGDRLDLSRERIHQLEGKALRKLRNSFQPQRPPADRSDDHADVFLFEAMGIVPGHPLFEPLSGLGSENLKRIRAALSPPAAGLEGEQETAHLIEALLKMPLRGNTKFRGLRREALRKRFVERPGERLDILLALLRDIDRDRRGWEKTTLKSHHDATRYGSVRSFVFWAAGNVQGLADVAQWVEASLQALSQRDLSNTERTLVRENLLWLVDITERVRLMEAYSPQLRAFAKRFDLGRMERIAAGPTILAQAIRVPLSEVLRLLEKYPPAHLTIYSGSRRITIRKGDHPASIGELSTARLSREFGEKAHEDFLFHVVIREVSKQVRRAEIRLLFAESKKALAQSVPVQRPTRAEGLPKPAAPPSSPPATPTPTPPPAPTAPSPVPSPAPIPDIVPLTEHLQAYTRSGFEKRFPRQAATLSKDDTHIFVKAIDDADQEDADVLIHLYLNEGMSVVLGELRSQFENRQWGKLGQIERVPRFAFDKPKLITPKNEEYIFEHLSDPLGLILWKHAFPGDKLPYPPKMPAVEFAPVKSFLYDLSDIIQIALFGHLDGARLRIKAIWTFIGPRGRLVAISTEPLLAAAGLEGEMERGRGRGAWGVEAVPAIQNLPRPSSPAPRPVTAAGLEGVEAFLRALAPAARLEAPPLVISAGLEARFPPLAGLAGLERYGIYRQGDQDPAEVVTRLIAERDARHMTLAGLEQEVRAFEKVTRPAGISLRGILPGGQNLLSVILPILSAYSGLEQEAIESHQGFAAFMAGLEALSPAA